MFKAGLAILVVGVSLVANADQAGLRLMEARTRFAKAQDFPMSELVRARVHCLGLVSDKQWDPSFRSDVEAIIEDDAGDGDNATENFKFFRDDGREISSDDEKVEISYESYVKRHYAIRKDAPGKYLIEEVTNSAAAASDADSTIPTSPSSKQTGDSVSDIYVCAVHGGSNANAGSGQ